MTRIVSVLGVATLVLLSGCESAVKKDYVKDLAGTWNASIAVRLVNNPLYQQTADDLAPLGLEAGLLATLAALLENPMLEDIPASSNLVLTITDGNSGAFRLVMTSTAALPPGALPPGLMIPPIVYTLTGDLKADGKKVTISGVKTVSTPIPDLARTEALEILEGDTEFDYTLEGDSLTISSPSIPILLQVEPTAVDLKFTKSS
ncbi:MAG: hypothetical protein OXP69_17460 [Spirochaetaceae bacterium]|nr:hypothetical protein [Spirochaetaceae bacterium]